MKKIHSLVFFAFIFLSSVTLSAQKIDLELNNVSIQEVVEKIQKNYGYSFSIRTSDVDISRKISVSVQDADIRDVLDQIFTSDKVVYKIDGKIISVTEAVKQAAVPERTLKLSGVVVDAEGSPVIGAAVMQKGTSNGASTDLDGKFSFSVTGGGECNCRNQLYRLFVTDVSCRPSPCADSDEGRCSFS